MKADRFSSGWLRASRSAYVLMIGWLALLLNPTFHVQAQPTITVSPTSLTVYEGDSARFTATSPGSSRSFSWLKNGFVFGGPTGPFATNLILPRAQLSDAGEYAAAVTSVLTGLSSTSAPPAHLTVLPGVGMIVNVAGSGAVFSTPPRISAPGPATLISAKFAPGTSVTLTATPAAGWKLSGWSVDGVDQPGVELNLAVTMNTAHAIGVAFSPLLNVGSYAFIAISGESSSGGPVAGGNYYFDSVSVPQISDSGRVLFAGNLVGPDPAHPVRLQERTGLWYSRTRIAAHPDNAIVRQSHSYFWYTPTFYPLALREMRAVSDFGAAFTSDGDIALSARMFLGGNDLRSAALVYEPYAEYRPESGAGIPIPLPEAPQFQTVVNPDQSGAPGLGELNIWRAAGGAVFQGDAPGAVGVISGGSRVAFSGTYVTYGTFVDPTTSEIKSHPIATNSGLFSGTRMGGIGLVFSLSSVGPGFRSVGSVSGGIQGSGRGALASIATYSGGSDAGNPVVWTDDGGILARVGSPPPNLPAGYPANTRISNLLNLHLSKLGAVAFLAELTGTGLTGNKNLVYLRRRGQGPVAVVRGGELIVGAPAPANLFLVAAQDTLSIADNSEGDLAVGTHVCCAGGGNVIIRHDSSGNHLAFIDGTAMPAFGANKKLYLHPIDGSPAFWRPPTINAQGRIAFFGIVAESSFLGDNRYSRGVWMVEPDGSLRQLLVEGQILPEFGRVDVIGEPRGNRWFNNRGEIAVKISQTIQFAPTYLEKTAILKITTGPALLPALGPVTVTPSGGIVLRWPAEYPDAVIERRSAFDGGLTPWNPFAPTLRRVGPDLETEFAPIGGAAFFRLLFPNGEIP